LEIWRQAFAEAEREHGVGLGFFAHREKGEREALPFDHIDCEVTKPYLWKARMAALGEAQVPDCAYGEEICTACGACDYEVVDTIVYHPKDYRRQPAGASEAPPPGRTLLRLRYAKQGVAVALSHLETMTALLRTFRRAGLSMPHSQGFHPKPKVSFGPACPVGTESHAEYLDLELFGTRDASEVAEGIRGNLPEGFRVVSCEVLRPGGASLARTIRGIEYRVELPEGAPDAAVRLAEFAAREEATVLREREGKQPVRIDLKKSVDRLVAENAREIRFTLRAGENEAVARPSELLAALFGTELTRPGVARIVRENAIFGVPAA
ncbi:MAG TPA: TIGR03936 family radical SAM-associated protein, partial [Myxococcales bacterium]|nr:TIGR03936 family radical SAM-associated protein [Myxococcales bacterium]